jgi:hypothetical protein
MKYISNLLFICFLVLIALFCYALITAPQALATFLDILFN